MLAAAPTSALVERLPPDARAAIEDRWAALVGAAAPAVSVVDLGADLGTLAGGRFDQVRSVGAFAEHADLPAALAAVAAALAPDGELLFVEPVAAATWWATVRASAGSRNRLVAGLHVHRDLEMAVRAAGLVIPDLDRFEPPGMPFALRHWVACVARHPYREAGGGTDAGGGGDAAGGGAP